MLFGIIWSGKKLWYYTAESSTGICRYTMINGSGYIMVLGMYRCSQRERPRVHIWNFVAA